MMLERIARIAFWFNLAAGFAGLILLVWALGAH